jgi:hypothetical protein
MKPNYALDNAISHASKARRAQAIWPEVTVVPWDRLRAPANSLLVERE